MCVCVCERPDTPAREGLGVRECVCEREREKRWMERDIHSNSEAEREKPEHKRERLSTGGENRQSKGKKERR